MIYFIRPTSNRPMVFGGFARFHRPVKIGYAVCPKTRLAQLACIHRRRDLKILGIMPGGVLVEQAMHEKFDHLRYRPRAPNGYTCHPEWFEPAEELLDFARNAPGPGDVSVAFSDYTAMVFEAAARRLGMDLDEFLATAAIDYIKAHPKRDLAYPFRVRRPRT